MTEPQKRSIGPFSSLAKYRYGALLASWCVTIFVLSSVPGNTYPQVSWEYADKLVHVNLYLVGGLLASLWYSSRGWSLWFAMLFCAMYGLSDELHQLLVPRRSFSCADLLADCTGAATGVLFFMFLSTYRMPMFERYLPYNSLSKKQERLKTT